MCEFDENLNALRSIPLFSGMPLESLKAMAYLCKRFNYKEGHVLIEQGQRDDTAYFIVSGEVEALRNSDAGEKVLAAYGPEKFIGVLALMGDVDRLFTLKVTAPAVIMTLKRSSFQNAMARSEEFMSKFLQSVAQRIVRWEKDSLAAKNEDLANGGVSLI